MAKKTPLRWLLGAACVVSWGGVSVAWAAPAPVRNVPQAQPAPAEYSYQDLVAKLDQLGRTLAQVKDPDQTAALQVQQAEVLTGLAVLSRGEEQVSFFRQAGDCLHTVALSDAKYAKTAHDRLLNLEAQINRVLPGTFLIAQVAYQELEAAHWARLNEGGDSTKAQEEWRAMLTRYVQTYPRYEQAASVLMELALTCELLGHDKDASRWYQQVVQDYPEDAQAQKAAGAARRLGLTGSTFFLALPTLDDLNVPYDIDQLRGKIVVVYFWASWDHRSTEDFQSLKNLLRRFDARVELVTVSLDATPEAARDGIHASGTPGVHLYQRGGLDGRIATRYGLTSVPAVFLLDADGKVAGGMMSVGGLEEAIKQLEQRRSDSTSKTAE